MTSDSAWTVSSIMDTFMTAVGGSGIVRGETGMVPDGTPVSMLVTCLSWVTPSSHLQMFFGQLLRPAQAVTHQ